MLFRTNKEFCLIVIMMYLLASCSDNHLGNRVYIQPMYEAIDVGSSLGSCIFVGDKQGGYTSYERILIHSEVVSYYQEDDLVYVKQEFDAESFKSLVLQELKYTDLNRSYIPDEIHELVIKDSINKESLNIIDSSGYFKNRMNNGQYNYYVLNIKDHTIKSFFKESGFLDYLNNNKLLDVFKEL